MADQSDSETIPVSGPADCGHRGLAEGLDAWRAASIDHHQPRLQVIGPLGHGSQGCVVAARDADCQRVVAAKALHPHRNHFIDRAQFLREIQITAQLEHPGVVPVHDVGVLPDGTAFYTMKRVEGKTLSDLLSEGGASDADRRVELLQIMLKVCDTLAFAHYRGVIHRDLKPGNLMIGRFGEVLVLDWGLAKVIGTDDDAVVVELPPSADPGESLAGFTVGTPAYMSPEQARGKPVDARSDIYSVGVILYRVLTGSSPYASGTSREIMDRSAGGDWRRLEADPIGRRLPRRLQAIVHRCMAMEPDQRYPTAEALATDLRRYLDGHAVEACRETPIELLVRSAVRHRRPVLAVVATLGLAGLVWGVWAVQASGQATALRQRLAMQAQDAESDNRLDDARRDLERLQDLVPEDRNIRRAIERIRTAQRRIAETNELARRSNEAARLCAVAQAQAAQAGPENLRQAMETYQQALGLAPGDPRALEGHREAAGRLAVQQQREEQERIAVGRQAQVEELRRRAEAAARSGDPGAAAVHLEAALSLAPSVSDSHRLSEFLSARDEAERQRRRAERRGEAEALALRARLALAVGHGREAQEAVERIRGLDPADPALPELSAAAEVALKAERSAAAQAILVTAAASTAQARELLVRQEALEQDRQRAAADLAESPGSAPRAYLQAQEQAIAEARALRSTVLARTVALLHQALTTAPGDPAPPAALADFWVARLTEADAVGDEAAAAAAEAQARLYDDGRYRGLIEGQVTITVPVGAPAVRLRALKPGPERTLQPAGSAIDLTSGGATILGRGRWLAEGPTGVLMALRLDRGTTVPLVVPTTTEAVAGLSYIPSGQLYGRDGSPGLTVAAFLIGRHEVTVGEWQEFLADPAVLRQYDEALAAGHLTLVPRANYAAEAPLWRRDGLMSQGRFIAERQDGTPIALNLPITGISPEDARAYAAWRASRDHLPWRLPTVAEWTLAVQGGDGRRFPWGDADDASLCASAVLGHDALPVGSVATDTSVQGVRDLAGSVSEYAQAEADSSTYPLLGGNRLDRDPARFGWSQHRDVDGRFVHPAAGLRLAMDVRR